jgi:hypothetical protein
MALKPIRTYAITVDGFPPANYSARSPAKARARAWRDYIAAYDCSFKRFMQISRLARVDDPPGVGRRILVAGEPATVVIGYGQYVHYMRDDSDVIVCSHPLDVTEMTGVVGSPRGQS